MPAKKPRSLQMEADYGCGVGSEAGTKLIKIVTNLTKADKNIEIHQKGLSVTTDLFLSFQ